MLIIIIIIIIIKIIIVLLIMRDICHLGQSTECDPRQSRSARRVAVAAPKRLGPRDERDETR